MTNSLALHDESALTYVPGSREVAHYPRAMQLAFALAAKIESGTLTVDMPDHRRFHFSGSKPGPQASMSIHSLAFARRLTSGDIGIAEGYLAGEWNSPDLTAFLELFCANQHLIAALMEGQPVLRFFQNMRHWLNRNTRAGSRRNIHAHYDLGNDFYRAWLDPGMTYSSGLGLMEDGNLAAAQERKFAALAAATDLQPGQRVLEIGCGWGGFAEYAARVCGCHVTAVTISQAQFDYARARIEAAGLSGQVSLQLRDYRDIQGSFDRIISVEMFEAVGEPYWAGFFDVLRQRLAPGGRAGLQIITIREDIFPRYRREMDFIRRYIFPGGMLPTVETLRSLGVAHQLPLRSERAFGMDYALTCRVWRERFLKSWDTIAPMGFDERFRRCWSYYLAYCEAGFRAGTIDVRQMTFGA